MLWNSADGTFQCATTTTCMCMGQMMGHVLYAMGSLGVHALVALAVYWWHSCFLYYVAIKQIAVVLSCVVRCYDFFELIALVVLVVATQSKLV